MSWNKALMLILGFAFVGLLGLSTPANASDVSRGLQAANNGDYKTAAKLYKKACDGGIAEGCNKLGDLYEHNQGIEQNKLAQPLVQPTALCRDGTDSYSAHHRGSCSHHGGVAKFYQ